MPSWRSARTGAKGQSNWRHPPAERGAPLHLSLSAGCGEVGDNLLQMCNRRGDILATWLQERFLFRRLDEFPLQPFERGQARVQFTPSPTNATPPISVDHAAS